LVVIVVCNKRIVKIKKGNIWERNNLINKAIKPQIEWNDYEGSKRIDDLKKFKKAYRFDMLIIYIFQSFFF
jgi:hypothetical protein